MIKIVVRLRKRPDGVWEKSIPNSSVVESRKWLPLPGTYEMFMKEIKEDRIITVTVTDYCTSTDKPNLTVANNFL